MSEELHKNEKQSISKIKAESLNVLLDSYKETFNLEESRKDTLENKASMVLGFSGIITGLITGLFSSQLASSSLVNNVFFLVCFFCAIISFTVSGIFALLTVKLKNYMRPFATLTPEQIDDLLQKNEIIIKDEIIKNYSDALLNNQVLNNHKASKLNIAFYSATLGIALTLLASIFAFFPVA
ncbi:MAG: hypothetical protein ACTSYB_06595 [Candidatus Helarchaeota archaeon]